MTRMRLQKLFLIVGIALLLRVLWIIAALSAGGFAAFHEADTQSYVIPAASLLTHRTFATSAGPEIARTPGYPLLLSIGLVFQNYEIVTIGIQLVLSLVSVLLVFESARQAFDSYGTALIAAGLFAVEPLSIIYSGILLPETLFTALLLVFTLLMLRYFHKPSWRRLLLASVCLAGATFVRPITYYLPLLIGMFLLPASTSLSLPRRLVRSAVFTLVCYAILLTWQHRNAKVAGYWGFSSIQEINLYFYTAAALEGEDRGVSLGQIQNELGFNDESAYLARHPEQATWPMGQRLRYIRNEAAAKLTKAAWRCAYIHLLGSARVLFGTATPATLKMLGLPRRATQFNFCWNGAQIAAPAVSAITGYSFLLLFYMLAAVGLGAQPKNTFVALSAVMIGYLALVSGGVTGYSRFRHPIMPLLCILAAEGAGRLRSRLAMLSHFQP